MSAAALAGLLLAAALPAAETPPRERALLAAADEAILRGSSGEAVRALEEAAAQSLDPAPALLRAARLRRAAAEELWWKGAQLDAAGREAQACAEDARKSWQRGAPEAAQAALKSRPANEVAELVPAPAAEPLYLDAVCTALWARAQGVTALLERQAELRAYLDRAARLTPDLDEAGPDRELGRLMSSLPAYAGGDLEASRARFERALARFPSSPRTRIAYAEGVGVKSQDRALFEKQLEPVAKPDDKSPLADKARALLQRTEELFGK